MMTGNLKYPSVQRFQPRGWDVGDQVAEAVSVQDVTEDAAILLTARLWDIQYDGVLDGRPQV